MTTGVPVLLVLLRPSTPVLGTPWEHGNVGTGPIAVKACHAALGRKKMAKANLFDQALKVRWDDWDSTQLITMVGAILLQDELGFEVELVAPKSDNTRYYEDISKGDMHVAFEVWPMGKKASFDRFASFNLGEALEQGALAFNASIMASVRIVEACNRKASRGSPVHCRDASVMGSHRVLPKFLATAQGLAHFASNVSQGDVAVGEECVGGRFQCNGDAIWTPSHCEAPQAGQAPCAAQMVHVSPAWDPRAIEGLVNDLRLPVKVVYLGYQGHAEAF